MDNEENPRNTPECDRWRLAFILPPDAVLPERITEEMARQSCRSWLNDYFDGGAHITAVLSDPGKEGLNEHIEVACCSVRISSRYSVEATYRRDAEGYWSVIDVWPYRAASNGMCLYLVLRQAVAHPIKDKREKALQKDPRWQEARKALGECVNGMDDKELRDYITAMANQVGGGWDIDALVRDYLAGVAASELAWRNLPSNRATGRSLAANVTGDPATAPEAVMEVYTFLLCNPERPELWDVVQTTTDYPLFTENKQRREALTVAQHHLDWIEDNFKNVRRVSGRQVNTGGRRRAAEVQAMISKFLRSRRREADWNRLHTDVVTFAENEGGDGKKEWATVREALRAEHGITLRSIKQNDTG